MFCLFVDALYDYNVTKTSSCVHLNVTGEQISLYPCMFQTVPPDSSFRLQVEGFNKRLAQASKVERIEVQTHRCFTVSQPVLHWSPVVF